MQEQYPTEAIRALEEEIQARKKELAQMYRSAPDQPVQDYEFESTNGKIKLSELFKDREELIVIHNMGGSCPYCTMWADGFNGILHHLEDRAPFVVVSPDSPETQYEFAHRRGWRFKMLSCENNKFADDLDFRNGDSYLPGFSVFRKAKDGSIFRTGYRYFGPGDDFCSAWHMFEILPEGPGKWGPKFSY